MDTPQSPTIIIRGHAGQARDNYVQAYIASHGITSHHITRLSPPKGKKIIPIEDLRNGLDTFVLSSQGQRCLWIDDVDTTLAIGAIQVLLKICEEPPPQACIIMTTMALDRLPATLRSRSVVEDVPTESTSAHGRTDHKASDAFIQAITGGHAEQIEAWVPHAHSLMDISALLKQDTPWSASSIHTIATSAIPMRFLSAAVLCWYERHRRAVPPIVHDHIAKSQQLDMPDTLSKFRLLYLLEWAR